MRSSICHRGAGELREAGQQASQPYTGIRGGTSLTPTPPTAAIGCASILQVRAISLQSELSELVCPPVP